MFKPKEETAYSQNRTYPKPGVSGKNFSLNPPIYFSIFLTVNKENLN